MNVILGFIILVVIAFIGARITLLQKSFSVGFQLIFLGGTEYLFVGLIMGPWFTNIITESSLLKLAPVLSLGLGWIGFMIGLQFEKKVARKIPVKVWLKGSFISVFTFVSIFSLLLPIAFKLLLPVESAYLSDPVLYAGIWTVCFALSCIGTVSTYSALAVIQRDSKARGGVTHFLQLLTEVRAPIAIASMGVWYALFHVTQFWGQQKPGEVNASSLQGLDSLLYNLPLFIPMPFEPVMQGVVWLGVTLLLGVALGFMFHYLLSERLTQQPLLLITSGTVILSSGLASYLHLSPLFVNFIMGVTYANLPSFQRNRVTQLIISTEHPYYVVFLILVGAHWPPITPAVLIFTLVYLLLRALGLSLGVLTGRYLFYRAGERPSKILGLGMLPQGGVAIALVIDFMRIYPGDLAGIALGTIILSLLINQLVGPTLLHYVLKRAGEVKAAEKRESSIKKRQEATP